MVVQKDASTISDVMDLIGKYVPNFQLRKRGGSLILFAIPVSSLNIGSMLAALEDNREKYQIVSMSLAVDKMFEIFAK